MDVIGVDRAGFPRKHIAEVVDCQAAFTKGQHSFHDAPVQVAIGEVADDALFFFGEGLVPGRRRLQEIAGLHAIVAGHRLDAPGVFLVEAELDGEGAVGVPANIFGHLENAVERRLLVRLEAVLALGRGLDAADHHVGGMRLAENRVERQRACQPSHHPADRRVAEILVGDERVDVDEVAERPFEAFLGARPEEVVLVETIQGHHGIDRCGIEREQDERLRLLPGAVAAIQHQERLAVRADVIPVQLLLEIARRRRRGILAELRGDRSAGQQDDVAIRPLQDGEIVTEQTDVVDERNPARGIGMVDEGDIWMRVERVDIAARRTLGRVANVGVLGALVEFGCRRVAAILDVQPDDGGNLDDRHRENDADQDRHPAEYALFHRPPVTSWCHESPATRDAVSPASECCARQAATAHP